MSNPSTEQGAGSREQALRELLAQHQEIGRLQGNKNDQLERDLAATQAELRAAQEEIRRLNTRLNAEAKA